MVTAGPSMTMNDKIGHLAWGGAVAQASGRWPPDRIMETSMHQKLNQRVVDLDPQETAEWMEALDQVIDEAGPDRAAYILEQLTGHRSEERRVGKEWRS